MAGLMNRDSLLPACNSGFNPLRAGADWPLPSSENGQIFFGIAVFLSFCFKSG